MMVSQGTPESRALKIKLDIELAQFYGNRSALKAFFKRCRLNSVFRREELYFKSIMRVERARLMGELFGSGENVRIVFL